jgi:hypothetical protein
MLNYSMADFSLANRCVLAETEAVLRVSLRRTAPAMLGSRFWAECASAVSGLRIALGLNGFGSLVRERRDLGVCLGWTDILRENERELLESERFDVKANSSTSSNHLRYG